MDRHERITAPGDDVVDTDGGTAVPEGTIVGGYSLEQVIGRGGMGVVYRARDLELGRAVALKLIHPALAEIPGFREMFVRESLVAASVEHPSVLPVYRSGQDGEHLYIAMRFVQGGSLADHVQSHGPLPAGRAARIVATVAEALEAAHSAGLVHRDVKPANILIADADGDEHVYLADFGISAPVGTQERSNGRPTGTPAYSSPEQLAGHPSGKASDIYSLGCVLFFALTGRAPFVASTDDELRTAHLTSPVPSLSELAHGVPAPLEAVVNRAMAKRPDDRFVSAMAFGRAAMGARFDLLVVHDPASRGPAETLVRLLAEHGLQATLADGAGAADLVGASGACAVLVGRNGLGNWARPVLTAATDMADRDRSFRLLAALLPGAPDPHSPDLTFFQTRPWVDLREGFTDVADEVIRAVRGASPAVLGAGVDTCPYRGLEPFDEEHAQLFVGRELDVTRVLNMLRSSRFVAVVGPSGSGKSSLVSAGVVPALRAGSLPGSDSWMIIEFRPGSQPLEALANRLAGIRGTGAPDAGVLAASERAMDEAVAGALDGQPKDRRILFVIDQFEELFTLCADPAERERFLDNLTFAATIPGGRAIVVLTMRADFYHRLAEHDELRALVATWQHLVGPLDARGLRRVIEEPAARVGLVLEPGLVRRILSDIADRPGTLPLLSHVLVALWTRRRGRTMTLESYEASGGARGALARSANAAFDALEPARQEVARRVLLRLTQPGEGVQDTRRQAAVRDLATDADSADDVDAVLSRLTDARLLSITTDPVSGERVVDVAHEALIAGWPRLKAWIDDDREALRMRRRLADAAREWEAAGQDDELLARGARLGLWDDANVAHLNTLERTYLTASHARRNAEAAIRKRRIRSAFAVMGAGILGLAGAALFGFVQRNNAAEQRDLATSRQLAATARLQLVSDPELSLLLAREAERVDASPEAAEILRLATIRSTVRASHRAHRGAARGVTVLPGGVVVSGGDDGTLGFWDGMGTAPTIVDTGSGGVRAVANSPNGALIASAGADGRITTWTRTGQPGQVFAGHAGPVESVHFSRDGATLVSGGEDGTVRLWPMAGGAPRVLRPHSGPVSAVSLSPDNSVVASAGRDDFTVRLSDVDGGASTVVATALQGVFSVAFNPDGTRVVAGFGDNTARIIPLANRQASHTLEASSLQGVNAARFSPNGRFIVTAGGDGRVAVWSVAGVELITLRGHAGRVYDVAFDRTGSRVVSAGEDGSVRVWEWAKPLPTHSLKSPVDFPIEGGASFTPDANGVVSVGLDASVRRWDLTSGRVTELWSGGPESSYLNTAAVSPDQRVVAGSRPDGTVEVRTTVGSRTQRLLGDGVANWSLGFSPDGSHVVAGRDDGNVRVWRVGTSTPTTLDGHTGPVNAVAFGRDETQVVSAGDDGVVRLWDVSTPTATTELNGHDGPVLAVAVDPAGERVATGGRDRTARLWTIGRNDARVLRGHANSITSIEFSRTSGRILTVSDDQLRVWDPATLTTDFQIESPDRLFYKATFGPDDRKIAVQTLDARVLIFDCETCRAGGDVLRLAAQRVSRTLTAEERAIYDLDG